MPPKEQEKIMHVSLTIGNGVTIMATDWTPTMGPGLSFGNNFHICIQAENEKEVDKLFAGLCRDGFAEMPPNKTFWGAYFAMCKDKFGIQWMINYSEIK